MEIVITVAIITLCICNLAILGLIALILLKVYPQKNYGNIPTKQESDSPVGFRQTEEEIERDRRKYYETEKAFQEMMNFSADVAYGINNNGE